MITCQKKFWLENPSELFCRNTTKSLQERMNLITQAIFFIFLVLIIYDPKISIIFLIPTLSFVIILYYIQKRRPMNNNPKENFKNKIIVCNTQSKCPTFCNDQVQLNPNYPPPVSNNQALVGPPNPKTLIPPVIAPPPAALDYWRANNLINHSHINTESQHDTYLSGYQVSNCCDRIDACLVPENQVRENYGRYMENIGQFGTVYEGITDPSRPVGKICPPRTYNPIVSPTPTIEGYEYRPIQPPTPVIETFKPERPNCPGWVNTSCGYDSDQLKYNLPSNLISGNCEKTENMKEYNKNLYTQTIQPDIFTRNEIIEPINSNAGISFTQQFEPTTCDRDNKGLTYIEHDPRIYNPPQQKIQKMGVTESNVYDPRFFGYGTSYRSYTDENMGQTRFYYDDIDSIRRPNYIVRSNIDFMKNADTYGPITYKNKTHNNIRPLAQDAFLRSSLQQRTELQERLLRKRNAEMWQRRKYPIRTF